MNRDADRVSQLLAKWEELRDAGRECTPEELCRADPKLLDEVRQKIDAIRAIDERFPEKEPLDPEATRSDVTHSHQQGIATPDEEPVAEPANSVVRRPVANRGVFPWLIAVALLVAVVIVAWQWQEAMRRVESLEKKLAAQPGKQSQRRPKASKPSPQVTDEPDLNAPRYQRPIAVHWSNLGGMLAADKRFADAETCLQRALQIQDKLAEAEPSEMQSVEQVGTLHYLGFVCSKSNKPNQAEKFYRRAIELQRKLAADPKKADYTSQLGVGLNNLAMLLMKSRPNEAHKLLQEAVDCQYRALKIRPGDKNYCLILRQNLLALKALHEQQGDKKAMQAIEAKLSKHHAGCW